MIQYRGAINRASTVMSGYKKRDAIYRVSCDPAGIQTLNLHIRSVMLYSVELRNPNASAKVLLFFDCTNLHPHFFIYLIKFTLRFTKSLKACPFNMLFESSARSMSWRTNDSFLPNLA